MSHEDYIVNEDYLYMFFEGMRETKREITRSIEEAKEQRENISRAIESLQVPDSVLRGYGDELIPVKNSISKDIDQLQRLNLHIDYVMRRFEEVDNECAARFRTIGYELQETLGLERDSGMFETFAGCLKLIALQGVKAWSGFSKSIKDPAAQLEQHIKKWFKYDEQKADKTAIITMSVDRLHISNKNVLEETQGMYDYNKMKCLAPKSPPSTQVISKKGNGKIKIYYKDGRTTEVDFSNANGIKWLENNGWTDNPPSNVPPWGYIGPPPSWWPTSPPAKGASNPTPMPKIETRFMNDATYKDYKDKDVDGLLGLLTNGFNNVMFGAKSPYDTPTIRKYYYENIWPSKYAEIIKSDPRYGYPEYAERLYTCLENNLCMWMDRAGILSPNAKKVQNNWNNGSYVIEALLAYADLWMIGDIITFAPTLINLVKKFGMKVILNIVKMGAVKELGQLAEFAAKNGIEVTSEVIEKLFTKLCKGDINYAKDILISTKDIIKGKTVTEVVSILKLVEKPAKASLSNYAARVWYSWQKSLIKSKLDFSKPLKEVARAACEMRNSIREMARDIMKNQNLASFLDLQEPMATFESLVTKYSGPGYNFSGDALWNAIIEGSMKGRGLVDDLFKIIH